MAAALALFCSIGGAQQRGDGEGDAAAYAAAPVAQPERNRTGWRFLARDQRSIFTAPARVPARAWAWILPAAGGLAYVVAADRRDMSERIHSNGATRDRSLKISNAGAAALGSLPLYLYWRGWRHDDEKSRGTAVLAARAAVDTVVAAEILRVVTNRERPYEGGGQGRFFHGDWATSGFPSLHAATAWSIASVISRRYPGWLTAGLAYGTAAAVSVTRVTGREHFPSDVLVGGALGYLVGHFVGRDDGGRPRPVEKPAAAPAPQGSAYVPLDSWIYEALDRLAALGLIPSQTSGLRPWTRAECRRQMLEAEGRAGAGEKEAAALLHALAAELPETGQGRASAALDSIYVRTGVITGPALTDSYHFGQTWFNDQGRPFGRGWNSYEGFSTHFEDGRFFGAVQAEHQRAPGSEPYSAAARQSIAQLDGVPPAGGDEGGVNRLRIVEGYAGVRLGGLEFSAGKQALWWGPTYDSPLSFGNNAEPTKNFKVSTVSPVRIGPVAVRGEFVLGKLGGQSYTWRPWFNAQKLSFKLTENLEMGFTRWSIFWGVGHPITVGSFLRNFTSTNSPAGSSAYGARVDPGDRKGGFDFRYRVPGLRNWLTLYSDSYCEDDPSPLAAPRRAAINPGIYLARLPGLSRLDLRVEAPSTRPMGLDQGGQYNYFNLQYRSGNTNYGELLGNSVGRDGRAVEAWSDYHFSARDRVGLGFRQVKSSGAFVPGGGTQSDARARASVALAEKWRADVEFQYERFWVPALGGPRRNLSAVLTLAWEPQLDIMQRGHSK